MSVTPAAASPESLGRDPGLRWYVVHTASHGEARAMDHLQRQEFRAFYPRLRKTVRHARTQKTVLKPLFPGYLFVELDLSRDRWRSVNGTRGVTRIITNGEIPSPVPKGIVEALIARSDADGVVDWSKYLEVGQTVRIAAGPFSDFVGKLEHLDAEGRVKVLIDLLGRSVAVGMDGNAVQPEDGPHNP